MSASHLYLFALVSLALAACGPSGSASPGASGSTGLAPRATSAPQQAASGTTEAEDLATEADFEEEAEREIQAENLEAELAKLEKEMKQHAMNLEFEAAATKRDEIRKLREKALVNAA